MKEWLLENAAALIGYLMSAGLGTWIFVDKRKLKSERKKEEAEAMTGMQQVYNSFVDDVKSQYEMMSMRIKELEARVNSLQKECDELQAKNKKLTEEYDALQSKYNKLKEDCAGVKETKKKKTIKKSTVVS